MRRSRLTVRPPAGPAAGLLAALLALGALASAGGARAALPDGLVAYWNFDQDFEASLGGTAFDGTPRAKAGSPLPVIDPAGKFGGAARFVRADSQYVVIDAPVITQGRDHTYSAWYKLDVANIASADRYFVMESRPNYSVSYELRDNSGTDQGRVWSQTETTAATVNVSGAAGTGWHNIIVTYQANASPQHRIYRDGTFVTSMASGNPLSNTAGLVIGGHRDGTTRNWQGLIDDVAVWDRVLTPAEIAAIQTAPASDVAGTLISALGIQDYCPTGLSTFQVEETAPPDTTVIAAALTLAASTDFANSSILLTTGRAADGGTGDTDWGIEGDPERAILKLVIDVPAEMRSLHFTTQLKTAEAEAHRPVPVRDAATVRVKDTASGYIEEIQLDALPQNQTGTVNPTLLHAVDLSQLDPVDRRIELTFTVSDVEDGQYDSGLAVSWFYLSEEELPPATGPPVPITIVTQPIYSDVRLLAGTYSFSKDLITLPGPLPLRFSLIYNCQSARFGRLSWKWVHSYDIDLMELGTQDVMIRQGNGQSLYFEPDGFGGYQPKYGGNPGSLVKNGPGDFTYTTQSQLTYEFGPSSGGQNSSRLNVVRDARGNETVFTYTALAGDPFYDRLDRVEVGSQRLDLTYTSFLGLQLLTGLSANGLPIASFAYAEVPESDQKFKYHLTGITDLTAGKSGSPSTSSFTYDRNSNLVTMTNGEGEQEVGNAYQAGYLVRQANATADSLRFEYGPGVLKQYDRLNRLTTRHYDENGRLRRIVHPTGAEAQYEHDARGNLVRVTDALGGTTRMEYDAAGNLLRQTDVMGNVLEMFYDERNNLVRQVDQAGNEWTCAYDENNNLTSQTDPLGNTISYTYTVTGQIASKTDANGNTATYGYDGMGNLVRTVFPGGAAVTYTFDDLGHRTSTTDQNGNTSRLEYDVAGRLLRSVDPLGAETRFAYDRAGRKTQEWQDNFPAPPITKTYTYDETGQVENLTDGGGHTYTQQYDAAGQRTSLTDPLSRHTTFAYDDGGRLRQVDAPENASASATHDACHRRTVTDPNGNVTHYDYDGLGRVTAVTDHLGHTVSYDYDPRGNLIRTHNARGQAISYIYDDAGRLTGKSYPGVSISHQLDAVGNRLASDGNGLADASRTFDAVNHLLSRTDAQGRTVTYTYDSVGNVTSIVYPDHARVTYTYDAANRLQTVTDWDGRQTRYEYTRGGMLYRVVNPDGSTVHLAYDASGNIVSRSESHPATGTIFRGQFELNEVGQQTRADLTLPLDALPAAGLHGFTYEANQITAYDGQAFAYDEDGNLTEAVLGGAPRVLAYDALNRLQSIGSDAFQYDVDGYRVAALVGGQARQYVYDALAKTPRVLVEYDESGAIVARYVHGLGLISRQDAAGNVSVYHFDTRGSTVALTDLDGQITDRYVYGTYGSLLDREGATPNPFRFVGAYGVMDDDNGLYFMRSRYYSPELMRFVQKDQAQSGSLERVVSLNLHVYADGNPILRIDPNGDFSLPGLKALVTIVGAVVTGGDALTDLICDDYDWVDLLIDTLATVAAVAISSAVWETMAVGAFWLVGGAVFTATGVGALGVIAGALAAIVVVEAAALIGGNLVHNIGALIAGRPLEWSWDYSMVGGAIDIASDLLGGGDKKTKPGEAADPSPNDNGNSENLNEFWPDRDAFDGGMGLAAQSKMSGWALTGQACPMAQ